MRSSFAEEARLGASLTHPAIATVFDFGFHHENPFTVFEFIEGETLRELIERRGRLPLDEVRLIIGPIAQALDFAHARRIVHRDLKPENIRATEQRLFKILDLGLAREFSRQDDWRFAGTPAYAAPEQAAERASDGRTDQYALAVIIFEMLDRQPPVPERLVARPAREALFRAAAVAAEPGSGAFRGRRGRHPESAGKRPQPAVLDLHRAGRRARVPVPRRGRRPCRRSLLETEIKKMGGRWKTRFYPFALKRPRTHLALAPEALWAIHRTELDALADRGASRLATARLARTLIPDSWCRRQADVNGCDFQQPERTPALARSARIADSAGRPRDRAKWPRMPRRSRLPMCSRSIAEPFESTIEPRVEPVVLLKGRPATRFQLLGMVEAKGPNRRRSENGLAIRAAMMGADAVVDLNAERLPGFIRTEHRSSGTAVRAVDQEGRLELKSRWFDNQITRIRIPMLIMAFFFGGIARIRQSRQFADAEKRPHIRCTCKGAGDGVSLFAWLVIVSLTLGMSFLGGHSSSARPRSASWPRRSRMVCRSLGAWPASSS